MPHNHFSVEHNEFERNSNSLYCDFMPQRSDTLLEMHKVHKNPDNQQVFFLFQSSNMDEQRIALIHFDFLHDVSRA